MAMLVPFFLPIRLIIPNSHAKPLGERHLFPQLLPGVTQLAGTERVKVPLSHPC